MKVDSLVLLLRKGQDSFGTESIAILCWLEITSLAAYDPQLCEFMLKRRSFVCFYLQIAGILTSMPFRHRKGSRQLKLEHSFVRFQHFWILIARGTSMAFPCYSKHTIASDA